jgi:hypothetical protein
MADGDITVPDEPQLEMKAARYAQQHPMTHHLSLTA